MTAKMEGQSHGGMWKRGKTIGKGSFGTVSLATSIKRRTHLPPLIAVKSAEVSHSETLQKEREILAKLQGCPQILNCYGDEITTGNYGELTYNILLEYAAGGTLASRIKNYGGGGGLPEADVRLFTRSILQGLSHIHDHGYVHGDIKPQNILLVPTSTDEYIAKIGDFGSAKNTVLEQRKWRGFHCLSLRGTPLYMSPESVARKEQEAPSDIWALGCVVVEMISGKPAWNCEPDINVDELLSRIGSGMESPEIPSDMSKEGKDFLQRCFVRNSMFRWTAAMLLHHPFLSDDADDTKEKVQGSQTAPELLNDSRVKLMGSFVGEFTFGGRKRRRTNFSGKSSTGNDSFKPVSISFVGEFTFRGPKRRRTNFSGKSSTGNDGFKQVSNASIITRQL